MLAADVRDVHLFQNVFNEQDDWKAEFQRKASQVPSVSRIKTRSGATNQGFAHASTLIASYLYSHTG